MSENPVTVDTFKNFRLKIFPEYFRQIVDPFSHLPHPTKDTFYLILWTLRLKAPLKDQNAYSVDFLNSRTQRLREWFERHEQEFTENPEIFLPIVEGQMFLFGGEEDVVMFPFPVDQCIRQALELCGFPFPSVWEDIFGKISEWIRAEIEKVHGVCTAQAYQWQPTAVKMEKGKIVMVEW